MVLAPGQRFASKTSTRFGIEPANFYKTINFK